MSGAVGMLELSSIAAGFVVQDAMIKAADIELLVARTICPGKYMIVIGGKVGSVNAAVEAGLGAAEGFLVEKLILPNIDPAIFPAISGCVSLPASGGQALGVIETFSAAATLRAADAAVKAAGVTLFRVHLSMAVGGKGFLLLTGDVGAVQSSVAAGVQTIKDDGMLVNKVVISGASKELFKEYL